jgi:hypothetical protein
MKYIFAGLAILVLFSGLGNLIADALPEWLDSTCAVMESNDYKLIIEAQEICLLSKLESTEDRIYAIHTDEGVIVCDPSCSVYRIIPPVEEDCNCNR